MNKFFLVLQATYTCVEYALYNNDTQIARSSLVKTLVCTELMYQLCLLIEQNNLTWSSIAAIIVNNGPAPFTTLRGLIATVNGISFAQHIPLIAVNGLEAFEQQLQTHHSDFLIVLNAFAGDFYYLLHTPEQRLTGCATTSEIAAILQKHAGKNLYATGNGVPLLHTILTSHTQVVTDPYYEYVSLEHIATQGLKKYYQSDSSIFHVSPLYLKTVSYTPSCNV